MARQRRRASTKVTTEPKTSPGVTEVNNLIRTLQGIDKGISKGLRPILPSIIKLGRAEGAEIALHTLIGCGVPDHQPHWAKLGLTVKVDAESVRSVKEAVNTAQRESETWIKVTTAIRQTISAKKKKLKEPMTPSE